MAEVIYRKYRPRAFADIVGQDNVVNLLKTAISSGEISHAYLFSGPRGTGKTSTARILAKAVSCLNFNKNGDVCNECAVCVDINNGTNMDLVEIDAASNRGIEEIRQLKDNINFLPTTSKYKVYIIDEVHMLTKEAFNALLKTLEEPPSHVIFILATTEPHKIPLTVLSRLQKYTFKLASPVEMVGKLRTIAKAEGIEIDDEALALVADMSEGGYRDAESLLGKLIVTNRGEAAITSSSLQSLLGIPETSSLQTFVQFLTAKQGKQAAELIEDLYRQGTDLHQFQSRLVDYLSKQVNAALLEGKILNNELNILQNLLKLQSDYQYIDNSKLILQLLILKVANLESSHVSQPNQPEPPKKAVESDPKPVESMTVVEVEPTQVDEISAVSGDDTAKWEALLTQIRKVSLQLWLIVKVSRLEWDNNLPVMVIGHPAHLDTLNSESFKSKLQDALHKIYEIDTEVPYRLEQNISFKDEQPSANSGSKLSSDNSQLVESIF